MGRNGERERKPDRKGDRGFQKKSFEWWQRVRGVETKSQQNKRGKRIRRIQWTEQIQKQKKLDKKWTS